MMLGLFCSARAEPTNANVVRAVSMDLRFIVLFGVRLLFARWPWGAGVGAVDVGVAKFFTDDVGLVCQGFEDLWVLGGDVLGLGDVVFHVD